jgi:hypothetical protein
MTQVIFYRGCGDIGVVLGITYKFSDRRSKYLAIDCRKSVLWDKVAEICKNTCSVAVTGLGYLGNG